MGNTNVYFVFTWCDFAYIANNNPNLLLKSLAILSIGLLLPGSLYAQDIHRIAPQSPAQLHSFFHYRQGNAPIISGHRGGTVPGFPENSIEAPENTLHYTPAIFEDHKIQRLLFKALAFYHAVKGIRGRQVLPGAGY